MKKKIKCRLYWKVVEKDTQNLIAIIPHDGSHNSQKQKEYLSKYCDIFLNFPEYKDITIQFIEYRIKLKDQK